MVVIYKWRGDGLPHWHKYIIKNPQWIGIRFNGIIDRGEDVKFLWHTNMGDNWIKLDPNSEEAQAIKLELL